MTTYTSSETLFILDCIDFAMDNKSDYQNYSIINNEMTLEALRDKVYQDVVAKKYRSYKNMLGLESKQVLDENPWLDSAFESIWRGMFITGQAKTQTGDRVKRFLNENKFFSAILPELDLSDD